LRVPIQAEVAPECVPDAILKENEAILVDLHQVSGVEEDVALLQHISDLLPLRLLRVVQIPVERSADGDL